MVTNDDQVEQSVYSANRQAEKITKATTDSVGKCNELGDGVDDFLNNPYYKELVNIDKLSNDKEGITSLKDIHDKLLIIDGLCNTFDFDPEGTSFSQYQKNDGLLDDVITNFKNAKKITSILTFLYNNGGISSIVFFYNKHPDNEEIYYKPKVIGILPYDYDGNLNYPDSVENYDTFYVGKETNLVKDIVKIIYNMLDAANDVPKKDYNDLNAILPKLNDDSELPPSSVKYNIIAKNEFIKSIKLSANMSSNEMIINTDKGNVIKLGNLMDDMPPYEYKVKNGNKNIDEWYDEYNEILNDPTKSTEWKPASITNSEEHRKASEVVDKYLNDRGSDQHILVGALREESGPYNKCKEEDGGACFRWLDNTQWLDNVWYKDFWKEPNDWGGAGEEAAHMWGVREQNTNLRTLNDINRNTRGAMLMKRTGLNDVVTFESQGIGITEQIVEIKLNTIDQNSIRNLRNDKFVIAEKKSQIEDECDSKFRNPLKDTTDIARGIEGKIKTICTTSHITNDGGNSSFNELVGDMTKNVGNLEENINSRIAAAKGITGEGFSNMYVDSNNLKMSLFCLIIYAIIIFLIFKIINNSYLKNILILITIILFIIIINSNNSNNIENFSSNLNKNILLESINNIALKVKDNYQYQ